MTTFKALNLISETLSDEYSLKLCANMMLYCTFYVYSIYAPALLHSFVNLEQIRKNKFSALKCRHECPSLAFIMGRLMNSKADYKYKSSVTRPNLGLFNHIIARQCCGSGMFIPDPDFFSIPDPGSNKKR
jgi:hypothetical protein